MIMISQLEDDSKIAPRTSNSRGSDAGKVRARLDARRVKRQRAAPADLGLARVAEARVHEPEADDGHSAVQVHVDRAVLELAVDRAPAHVPGNEGRQAALVRRGQLVGQPPDVRPQTPHEGVRLREHAQVHDHGLRLREAVAVEGARVQPLPVVLALLDRGRRGRGGRRTGRCGLRRDVAKEHDERQHIYAATSQILTSVLTLRRGER